MGTRFLILRLKGGGGGGGDTRLLSSQRGFDGAS